MRSQKGRGGARGRQRLRSAAGVAVGLCIARKERPAVSGRDQRARDLADFSREEFLPDTPNAAVPQPGSQGVVIIAASAAGEGVKIRSGPCRKPRRAAPLTRSRAPQSFSTGEFGVLFLRGRRAWHEPPEQEPAKCGTRPAQQAIAHRPAEARAPAGTPDERRAKTTAAAIRRRMTAGGVRVLDDTSDVPAGLKD